MSVKKYAAIATGLLMLTFTVTFASAQSSGCSLTVKTTKKGGTVWGTVQVSYGGRTVDVSRARRTLSVPCGDRVTLREMPTNASSWQFTSWNSPSIMFTHPSNSTVHFTMSGSESVSATYTEQTPSGTASSSSSSSSSSWG